MFGFTKARRVLAEVLAEIEAMRADVVGFDDEGGDGCAATEISDHP